MTNQEIFELFARFEGSCVRSMKLSRGDFSLELSKDAAVFVPGGPGHAAVSAPDTAPAAPSAPAAVSTGGSTITAPLAGVFYAASAPGEKPYVVVGDRVKEGQTVCLMEAMKMISEIPAPCDCIITEICKENGTLAAYGEAIFRYQPC